MTNMMSDEVTLVKQDGRRFEGISANVQKEKIFIDDGSLPIEEGDRLTRELPNGLTESYLVLNRGFYEGRGSIGDHYQVDVQKESAIPRPAGRRTVIYNLHGSHSRVNIQSHDESVNIQTVSPEDLFSRMRAVLEQGIQLEEQKRDVLAIVDELEETTGTSEFTEKYKEFMSVAADHIGILSPFLPALAQLVS